MRRLSRCLSTQASLVTDLKKRNVAFRSLTEQMDTTAFRAFRPDYGANARWPNRTASRSLGLARVRAPGAYWPGFPQTARDASAAMVCSAARTPLS
jgi:hypothetical protein